MLSRAAVSAACACARVYVCVYSSGQSCSWEVAMARSISCNRNTTIHLRAIARPDAASSFYYRLILSSVRNPTRPFEDDTHPGKDSPRKLLRGVFSTFEDVKHKIKLVYHVKTISHKDLINARRMIYRAFSLYLMQNIFYTCNLFFERIHDIEISYNA